MESRYYWLKFHKDFFTSKRIKKLRSLAGGDTFTIIYLKMQLKALETDGVLEFTGIEKTFAEEIALDIDEAADNVGITINYLLTCGLMEMIDEKHLLLPYVLENTGSESKWAEKKRDYRQRLNVSQQALTDNSRTMSSQCPTEKEKEKNKDKEKIRDTYGDYGHVKLSDDEYKKLCDEYGKQKTEQAITFLDEYTEDKGYKHKNSYLTIKRWVMDAVNEKQAKPNRLGTSHGTDYNALALDEFFNESEETK